MKYPVLKKGATIGVTAPSSGVPESLHTVLKDACEKMEQEGFQVKCGKTNWTQTKAKSASAKVRALELNEMLQSDTIDMIIPPWGGELLIEILAYIDFQKMKPKWILGYSDTSVLLLAITLKTGIATAHGTNLVDLRGEYWDKTTAKWFHALTTNVGESVEQSSSEKYQKEWQHENPSPCVFHLTENTEWKTLKDSSISVQGRLLGGCVDVIRHLIGTPFGDVNSFSKEHINGDSIIWYLENCELSTTDLRRSLVQMKLAGWFQNASAIMFGRSPANDPVDNYTVEDVYAELEEELNIPILYDIDCGHVPPQVTFINGAYAEVTVNSGKGVVKQTFK
ncbi:MULTISPECIES: S66 family peptidase [Bacillus]|uniref:S66 family peptidase n=1 Tax=Bacillus TaxID=1386 RepID=UPI000BB95CBB|nr:MULTISPECIES: S66 peptidase family protein [Bacillus]